MRIQLIRANPKEDYLFEILEGQKSFLSSIGYCKKTDCLQQIKEVLTNLRNNDQIAIQLGNDNKYYFEIVQLAQSPSFRKIEAASAVLAQLKTFANQNNSFSVNYIKTVPQVVSKNRLGLKEVAQRSCSNNFYFLGNFISMHASIIP